MVVRKRLNRRAVEALHIPITNGTITWDAEPAGFGVVVSDAARSQARQLAKPRKRASTLRVQRGVIDNHILPAVGSFRAAAVKLQDIEALHRRTSVKAGPIAAHLPPRRRPAAPSPCWRNAMFAAR
jgi:hypothetical protein